jgi:hypothetical protein
MKTRAEHLAWCKQRALEYVERGDTVEALTSMGSDLDKHPETAGHPGTMIGMKLLMIGALATREQMRHFIEGFN